MLNKIKKNILKAFNNKNIIKTVAFGILILGIFLYVSKSNLKEGVDGGQKDPMGQCSTDQKLGAPANIYDEFQKKLKKLNSKHGTGIVHFDINDPRKVRDSENNKYTLKDYRILSSYTTAAGPKADSIKRGECMHAGYIKNALSMGARLLDFELFYDNKIDNILVKSGFGPDPATGSFQNSAATYNYLSGNDIFTEISKAFSMNGGTDGINNFNDPLIILFRIKTRDSGKKIYDKLTQLAESKLTNRLLPEKYGYNGNKKFTTVYKGKASDSQIFDWYSRVLERMMTNKKPYEPSKLSKREKKYKGLKEDVKSVYCRNAMKEEREKRKKRKEKFAKDEDIKYLCTDPTGDLTLSKENAVDGKYAKYPDICPDVCNEYLKPVHVLDETIENLKGKVIFAIDDPNKSYVGTSFEKYINIAPTRSRLVKNGSVFEADGSTALIDPAKMNLYISMPDYGIDSTQDKTESRNVNHEIHFRNGIQAVMMKFNRIDKHFEKYYEFFYKEKSAFVLKPQKLRFKQIPLGVVEDQDPTTNQCNEMPEIKSNISFIKPSKFDDSERRKRLNCK